MQRESVCACSELAVWCGRVACCGVLVVRLYGAVRHDVVWCDLGSSCMCRLLGLLNVSCTSANVTDCGVASERSSWNAKFMAAWPKLTATDGPRPGPKAPPEAAALCVVRRSPLGQSQ